MSRPLRPELPELTVRLARLPVHRGYPVPWFVGWLDDDGHAVERGIGTPDFRFLHPDAVVDAYHYGLCFVCGQKLGTYKAFVAGPMCAVSRTSAEPPSHLDCAEWSVKGCPFLTRPHMVRRENDIPPDMNEPAGIMLKRNPGVMFVWVTKKYGTKRAPNGTLFDMGEPEVVTFYREGRLATRVEVEESFDSGLPSLQSLADKQGPAAVRQLALLVERSRRLFPDA